jgi:hypothetical protein
MRHSTVLSAFFLCATVLIPATTHAQCGIKGASFTPYGQGCVAGTYNVPQFAGGFNQATCTIRLSLDAFYGYNGLGLTGKMILFGASPTSVPLPWTGDPACTLLVNPLASYYWATVPNRKFMLDIKLPPGTSPATVYVQGVTSYHSTVGRKTRVALSRALVVRIW